MPGSIPWPLWCGGSVADCQHASDKKSSVKSTQVIEAAQQRYAANERVQLDLVADHFVSVFRDAELPFNKLLAEQPLPRVSACHRVSFALGAMPGRLGNIYHWQKIVRRIQLPFLEGEASQQAHLGLESGICNCRWPRRRRTSCQQTSHRQCQSFWRPRTLRPWQPLRACSSMQPLRACQRPLAAAKRRQRPT